jgi:hypothetical protein
VRLDGDPNGQKRQRERERYATISYEKSSERNNRRRERDTTDQTDENSDRLHIISLSPYLLMFLGIFKWFIILYTEMFYTHCMPTEKSFVHLRFTFQEQCRVTHLYKVEFVSLRRRALRECVNFTNFVS